MVGPFFVDAPLIWFRKCGYDYSSVVCACPEGPPNQLVNPDAPAPIPIPPRYRWQSVRLRILPFVLLGVSFGTGALLWRGHISAPTMFGQAEPVLADVSSYKPGVVSELTVTRFQKVRAGDPLGKVRITEPSILASSLAVIQSEIDLLRAEMEPVLAQERNAIDYNQLRLDWMRQRTQLATARVNLQLAETEYGRNERAVQRQNHRRQGDRPVQGSP